MMLLAVPVAVVAGIVALVRGRAAYAWPALAGIVLGVVGGVAYWILARAVAAGPA